jgi:hypothetical protein
MGEMAPDPITMSQPAAGRFARIAATFSLFVPLATLGISFLFYSVFPHQRYLGFSAIVILFFWVIVSIPAGLFLGIAALVAARRTRSNGIFGKALAGTCINGLSVLVVAFVFHPINLPGTHSKVYVYNVTYDPTPQGQFDAAIEKLDAASTPLDRFYALDDAAKHSFGIGKIEDACRDATELLALASTFPGDWNYGNAIQDGNLVLGRIAVRQGHLEEAKRYLLLAGRSPGSPQMKSFGPNMTLAKDLLEKGERETVLQYFELCRSFWKMDLGKLNDWTRQVKSGKTPEFGANLLY